MASVYGSTVNHFRAKLDYSVTTSAYEVSITAAALMCSVAWGFSVNVTGAVSINGSSSSATGSFYSANGATVETQLVSKTVTVSRGTSAKTVTVSATINNASGYMNGTSTATATVTVPALESHTVSYDANGGSGAPSSQTKWYGTILTLSSTRPSRDGYTFLSWNTAQGGTGESYAPGQQFGHDRDTTLWAQWEQDYVAPSVTAASAWRVASSGSTEESPGGSWAYASFSWAVDTTLTPGNKASSVALASRAVGASSWGAVAAQGATSGTSGTVYGWFAADASTSYEVRVSVTDTSGAGNSTTTITRTVGVAVVPLSFANRGRGVGLLTAAPDEGAAVGGDLSADGALSALGGLAVGSGTQLAYVRVGTKIVSFSGGYQTLFSASEYRNLVGRSFDQTKDCVVAMNGDLAAFNGTVVSVGYNPTNDEVGVSLGSSASGSVRINYVIFAGA